VLGVTGIDVYGETVWHIVTDGRPDELFSFGKIESVLAGPAATVARQLRRLGTPATLHTALGSDHLGDLARTTLESEGVRIRELARGGRSARVLALQDPITQECRLIADVTDATGPSAAGVEPAGLEPITYLTGFPSLYPLAEALSADGRRLVVDTGFKPLLESPEGFTAHLRQLGPALGVCVISGATMSEARQQRHADFALELGAEAVLVTRGCAGVVVVTEEGRTSLPARRVRVVDTLCAGDAFVAGYLAGRHAGLAHVAAARVGQRVSEAKVQIFGGLPQFDRLPSEEEQ
jgi:sugar/nucleoside kinase (ribokinase family)